MNAKPTGSLSITSMIVAGVRHNWRVSASVALGVATATAVIIGALLVGDSMRGSLRALTIERLGKTEAVVIPGAFFDAKGITKENAKATALILFTSGVVESTGDASVSGSVKRAGSVQIIGCDNDFWELDVTGVVPKKLPVGDGVVLNASAAAELGAEIGDLVTLRLPVEQAVPADSPLGRRDIQTEGLPRMEVLDVIPDRGLGRFSISANQASPQNVYVSRETIGDVLQRNGQANALLFDKDISVDDLNVDLADLGLKLSRVKREFKQDENDPPETIYDYYSLTSDRLLLPEIAVDIITSKLPKDQVTPVSTYLANAIERLDDSGNPVATVTYSTISAIDSSDAFPLDYSMDNLPPADLPSADLASDVVPLVINSWTADRLDAVVGTQLRVAYFEPEVEQGKEIERYFSAVVTEIVPITKPKQPYRRKREAVFDRPPTIFNDPDFTPNVPGVTDQDSINDWDLPFTLERTIPKADDDYWKEYRLTPKAFLPLADGRRLFGSRFGQTTSLRIATDAASDIDTLQEKIQSMLQPIHSDLGWQVRRIKQQQLQASKGTTPFDALFLSLSFFVIFAAVLLIAMLFRLGLIERLRQFGTLLAIGWTPRRVTNLVLGEGLTIAAAGVLLGIVGGVLYAKLVLWALRTLWVGAVTVPFLDFHWTIRSLVIGAFGGWIVAGLALWTTVRALMKVNARVLLTGRDTDQQVKSAAVIQPATKQSKLPWIALAIIVFALVAAGAGATVGGQAAAGGFVGGGMMLLMATLILVFSRLRRPHRIGAEELAGTKFSINSLAARNASRHPLRSTLTIGLMASAAFLIIAISAFQLTPTDRGTGGFSLIAHSAQPLYRDLSDSKVQANTFGPDAKLFEDATVRPMRVRLGQDASCNNLYQASQPTVLGVPKTFTDGDGWQPQFDWAATGEIHDAQSAWTLLNKAATGTQDDPIPVILDQNTAMWSLQMLGGVGEKRSFVYEQDQPIYFEVVGLLMNSLLQGRLLIGEENFQSVFPNISGYQFFLISCRDEVKPQLASALESRLGDVGMDVSDSKTVLSGMLAVQNTYLRTFQSLGALGLLLGTIGLAVSQLRSVLERRRELAVMRAIGFTRRRLARVVMTETASLLLLGIGCGAICAFLAVLPHAILSGLKPPVVEPLVIVMAVISFGLIAGLVAAGRVLRMPLMQSLRPE